MRFQSSNLLLIAALMIGLAWTTSSTSAGTISLAWDPVVHENLAGYRIYYGTSPDNLNLTADVGLVTSGTLIGLSDCSTYHVAVRAVGTDGSTSPSLSNLVSGWARPELALASPALVEQDRQAQITIQGANYQPGATVRFSEPSITVDGVTVNDCHQVIVDFTVGASTPLGPVDVTVVNPDQVFGTGVELFSVIEDSTGPSISSVQASDVTSTSATINWVTDEPSDSQVFLRKVGDSLYQPTEIAPALVTDHSVPITGLIPATEYEYYVRSADDSGNASTASGPASFTTTDNNNVYMRLEAESVDAAAPLLQGVASGAFAGRYAYLSPGAPTGSAGNPTGTWDFGFHVPSAGTWHVWFRIRGETTSSDGWFEAVDGAYLAVVEPARTGAWDWAEARSYYLQQGLHTLTLGGYEGGARIDRILVTDDPAFLPTEQPGGDVTPPSAVAALEATPGDASNNLVWSNPSDSDLTRVVVVFRTDGRAPTNPHDGYPLVDRPAAPGAAESLLHSGLTNGQTYHYAVFAMDGAGNVAQPATAQATPEEPVAPLGQVQNVHRTDVVEN